MLTIATRRILGKTSSKETFVAHVIRQPVLVGGPNSYVLGISLGTGQPLGLVTVATGDVLRQWKRLSAIEEFLAVIGDRLIGIFVYPVNCPEDVVTEMLIQQYGLETADTSPVMDLERTKLLAALRESRSDSGRTQNPPNPR